MEVSGCGSFTHLQPDGSDLVTTLIEGIIKVLLNKQVGEVDGREVSLTSTGRGSPPMFMERTKNRTHSEMLRAGYITADNRR